MVFRFPVIICIYAFDQPVSRLFRFVAAPFFYLLGLENGVGAGHAYLRPFFVIGPKKMHLNAATVYKEEYILVALCSLY